MTEAHGISPEFVVVFRAPSAPLFAKGDSLGVRVLQQGNDVRITLQTRYISIGLSESLPGGLWIDARGYADSIEDAVSRFGAAVDEIVSMVAFCSNAAIADMEPELVFNNTRNTSKREFLQHFVPQEGPIVHAGRKINGSAVSAFIGALEGHPEKERIGRAILHYRLALRHWRLGHEVMATAHLFIAMETLTPCVVRTRFYQRGLTEEETARQLKINPAKLGPCQRLSAEINSAARRQLLFKDDDDCHRSAKAASDGLEHGYMPFSAVRERAMAVRDKTVRYLREAVLDFVSLPEETHRELLDAPYDEPLGHWPVVKYLRGELVGDSDQLAAPGNQYPIMVWRSKINNASLSDKGDLKINFDESFTAQLGEGITFNPGRFEVWRP